MEEHERRLNNRRKNASRSCKELSKKMIRKRLPIFSWLPTYKLPDLTSDIIAGITVGLTVVPQSMAYAAIAGLSPEYGLYSSYIGCFLYVILGSCKQVTIGPTAVMGLLTFETCGNDFPSCAILTGFYSGIFELLMAVLQLGWVVSFISESVVIGFTSAAACTIIASQIKNLLGIAGPKGSGFVGYWYSIFRDISTIRFGDCCMGITSFVLVLLLRKLKDYKHPKSPRKKFIDTACWFISVSRNVIIIVITSFIAFLWTNPPFKLTGNVKGGFPTIDVPSFGLPMNSTISDGDDGLKLTYWETWSLIGAGPLIVALISVLQNVAISKAFGSGQTIDATQEMFALGTASIVGSFFSSIPISGSFSRSAVNEASGVRSPMGGLFTGILVLLSLGFLTPSFYYIPKSSLAAVIIAAVMFMVEYEALPVMWKVNKLDAVFCLVTYVCALMFGMEYGIMVGVATSLAVLLIKLLRPQLNAQIYTDEYLKVKYVHAKPDSGISFPSVDHVRTSITKLLRKHQDVNIIAVNFERWQTFDYTAITALISLAKLFKKDEKVLIFVNLTPEWEDALTAAGLSDILCCADIELLDYIRKTGAIGGITNKSNNYCVGDDEELMIITKKCQKDFQNSLEYGATNGVLLPSIESTKPLMLNVALDKDH
ncbi:Sodium-independent sulfate anion transporter [Orchesella cincta]|uniref:Sodium-independent sulfate anion transporter n=1 Tax=Orchesella cincta TaxID=48709 RepID=A0A1D2NDX0_ORCCI|nr:Sodium-independent sulfate anion transporter [Orchesella cincta]